MSFSVIVPTMWKGRELRTMLPLIHSQPAVDEIILIDNDWEALPRWAFQNLPKIRYEKQETNIGVNPAWNLGVELAKNDNICLLSDDVIFHEGIFGFLNDQLPTIVGLHFHFATIKINGTREEILPMSWSVQPAVPPKPMPIGWATTLFLKKSYYKPIPKELKVFFGDVWLWEFNQKSRLPGFLWDFPFITKPFTTSASISGHTELFEKEHKIFQSIQ